MDKKYKNTKYELVIEFRSCHRKKKRFERLLSNACLDSYGRWKLHNEINKLNEKIIELYPNILEWLKSIEGSIAKPVMTEIVIFMKEKKEVAFLLDLEYKQVTDAYRREMHKLKLVEV